MRGVFSSFGRLLLALVCVLLLDPGTSLPTSDGDDAPLSPPARKPTALRLLPDLRSVYAQRNATKMRAHKFSRQADTDELMDRLLHIRQNVRA